MQPARRFSIQYALIFILAFAGCAAFLIYQSVHKPAGDFGNYYYGSSFLLKQQFTTAVYDPYWFNTHVPASADQFLNYTPVPPITALLYTPLTWMPVGTAKLAWNIFTAVLLMISLIRIFHFRNIDLRWALLVPLLFFIPMRSNIDAGQGYFLLVFLLAEGWMAMERERPLLAALCFAPAILLKIFPAIILLFLFFRKEWPSLILTVFMIAAMFGLSCIAVPWTTWKYYFTEIVPRLADGAINDPYAVSYQSMQVFLRKMFVPDLLLNPVVRFKWPVIFALLYALFKFIVFFLFTGFVAQGKRESLAAFSVTLLAGALLTGYGSVYGLMLLVFLVPAVLSSKWNDVQILFFLLLLGIAVSIPLGWLAGMPVGIQFLRLWLLIVLFILCIWQSKNLSVTFSGIAISLLVAAAAFFGNKPTKAPGEIQIACDHQLLHGYLKAVEDTSGFKLEAGSFSEKGNTSCAISFPAGASWKSLPVSAHSFRFESKDYFFARSWIKDAFVISETNRRSIWFLCDDGRGPGFYAIRSIRLQ